MINRVVLVGRLTKDPELRYTPNGVAVVSFTLAVQRPFSNQQGEREADFIQVVAWRRQAENVANYVGKGSLVGVDGRIQTRSYDNNEGRRVYITEVVADSVQFLEPKGSNNTGTNKQGFNNNNNNDFNRSDDGGQQRPQKQTSGNDRNFNQFDDDPFANDGKPIDISDDDLPF